MVAFTDYSARKLLDHIVGKTSFTMPTAYVGLFTAAPTDATSGTEVSGGSYARVATTGTTWNAASGSAPASNSNASSIVFPTATANWGTVTSWGLFDASSAGNMLFWEYLGNFSWLPFSCTSASPGVLTCPGHGFANGDSAVVTAEFGGVLPATAGSWSGLLTVAGITTDTLNLGVNTTGTGDGMIRKVVSQVINSGVAASLASSSLTISLS